MVQNARAANMPKDKIENAIKKASGQGAENYDIVLYEGYAPHGIAIWSRPPPTTSCARSPTCASAFKTYGGSMGAEGSVAFQFKRMGVFRLSPEALAGKDLEALELDLIDHGLEEMGEGANDKGEPQTIIRGAFADFGKLQAAIEARGVARAVRRVRVRRPEPGHAPRGQGEGGPGAGRRAGAGRGRSARVPQPRVR